MTHPLIAAQLEEVARAVARAERETSEQARVCNRLEWAERYRAIDGQPFTLARHKPLQAIYADDHPHIVVMKCAQVGLSEYAVTCALHALDMGARYWQTGLNGLNVAYLFPTIQALGDFSKERISGVMAESDHVAQMFAGGWDDITFKQVHQSYLYLRGAFTRGDGKSPGLKSFKADVLIRDEYDEMSAQAIAMSEKRVRASTVQRIMDISTPTLTGRGIHAAYLESDQRVWEVPCPSCGAWSDLDFWRDVYGNGQPYDVWQSWDRQLISAASWTVRCPSCKQVLDRFADGRWVARRPEVTTSHGYHIPALCFPMVDLGKLALGAIATDPTAIEEFWRSDLGLPFSREGTTIDVTMLDAAIAHPFPVGPWRRTCMGVDVGARYHVRISSEASDGLRYIRLATAVDSLVGLDTLIAQYQVRSVVIDAMPELNGTKQWADRHPGKVWRAFYPEGLAGERYRTKPDKREVQINRTMAMDALYSEVATGDVRWSRDAAHNPETRAHLVAPQRVTIVNKHGNPQTQWIHTAPDHLFHAGVYEMIARALLPKEQIGGIAGTSTKVKVRT